MMKTLLLDTNIYNQLAEDAEARDHLRMAIDSGEFRVIATPIIQDELAVGPLGGLPSWFPIEFQAESVAVVGYWRIGMAHLGDGATFTGHRGESSQTKDAIIADSAHTFADILVTNDKRARKRLSEISSTCQTVDFSVLREMIGSSSR